MPIFNPAVESIAKAGSAKLTGDVTLTGGSNVTLTQSGNDISIAASGGGSGMTWTEVTGTSQSAAVNSGYIASNAALCTITLPSTASVGAIVRVAGKGAGGWRVGQNSGQQILWNAGGVDGTDETTVGTGGHISSVDRYDAIELICLTADTTWGVLSAKGTLTLV